MDPLIRMRIQEKKKRWMCCLNQKEKLKSLSCKNYCERIQLASCMYLKRPNRGAHFRPVGHSCLLRTTIFELVVKRVLSNS